MVRSLTDNMIEVEDLSKRYGFHAAVSGLSFRVARGDVLGFIGPNGAGKTTTMKMLCGVLPVYSGSVRICSIDLSTDPRAAREKVGFLPENAPLHPSMTVSSFLDYAARMRGIGGRRVRREKIALASARCGLDSVMEKEIETLSKGFRRRVSLAQAILHEPPVLILDEPTDGLDPNQKREIRALIETLRGTSAIILSTHILEEVEAVCTRVLLLCAGKKVFEGTREEFLALRGDNEDMSALFARLTGEGGRT